MKRNLSNRSTLGGTASMLRKLMTVVVAKCIGCSETRTIHAGEIPDGDMPMCEKCGMPMIAKRAERADR
jgi:hypothetical protein